jgi:hypothetical protein
MQMAVNHRDEPFCSDHRRDIDGVLLEWIAVLPSAVPTTHSIIMRHQLS